MRKTNQGQDVNAGAESHMVQRLAELKEAAAELEKKLEMARGTGDVTEEARVAGRDLPKMIEAILRQRPRTLVELAKDIGEPAGRVSNALRPMKKLLFNAGTADTPAWFVIPGDAASTETINNAVRALIAYRPMYFPELLAATGARQGRVSGAIVAMQRDPNGRIVNLGTTARARWFEVPEGTQLSRLKRR